MKCCAAILIAFAAAAQPNASVLNERCVDAYARGEYAAAASLCRESIVLWQAAGPAAAPRAAIARVNLAQTLAAQGRRSEARSEVEQAVTALRNAPGPRDPHTLAAVNLLAALDVALGDPAAAEPILLQSLAIERQKVPPDLLLSRTLQILASVRLREQRLDEALALADESLRIAIRSAGDDSPDTALATSTAAEVHLAAGRPDRALPLYRRAHAIYERRFGPRDLRIVPVLTGEALILIADGKLSLAGTELQRATAILDRACPDCGAERNGVEAASALLHTQLTTATAKSSRR